jgi:hypothetical protein
MLRSIRLALGGLAIAAALGGDARAQFYYPGGYGYGGYGFGGWSETPQGTIAMGLGAFARGEGVYNYDSAVAGSIDENTVVRYNQYLYNSMLEARRRYNREHANRLKLTDAQYQQRQARLRDNPSNEDIDSGDAMNVLLDQLSDPKVMQGSSLRMASGSISPETIREIPFRDETDAITLSLDQMTDQKNWPAPLRAEAFRPEREAYQKAVDDALAEDQDGSIKPETVARVRNAVAALYRKVGETIPKTQNPDHTQAMNYLKGLAGMSRMLERPNVEAVLAELKKVKTTTVGNLLAFMHTYNLRFAPAETPKQKAAYRELAPRLVEARDKILGRPSVLNGDNPPPAPVENPTALFHGFDPTHLNPAQANQAAPANPTPGAPNPTPNPAPTAPNPAPKP